MDTNIKESIFKNISDLKSLIETYIENQEKYETQIEQQVKNAYKDGYGTALQKVLNIVNEIDKEDIKPEIKNNVDEYLSLHKGNYRICVENIIENKYLVVDILSRIKTSASKDEIDLWICKHVLSSRSWAQLFLNIDSKTCSTFADIINLNPDRYKFVNYQYEQIL